MSRAPSLRHRRGRSHLLPVVALAAALALPGALLPGVFAAGPQAHAAEEPEELGPVPSLVVAPETPVLAADAEQARFSVLLRNPGDEPLAAGVVSLRIDNDRAEAPADLDAAAERDALDLGRVEVAETPAGEDQVLEIAVPRGELPLVFTRVPGVYPVRAEFAPAATEGEDQAEGEDPQAQGGGDADGEAAQGEADPPGTEVFPLRTTTPLIWETVDAGSPVPVTLVVPLVLPSTVRTLPSSAEIAAAAPGLIELIDAAERHGATLAVDPRIVAAIRALGEAAPGSASTLLERLERTPLQVFLLQFADADPAVQAALGFESLLQPVGLDHATQFGRFEEPDPADGDQQPPGDNPAADQGAAGDRGATDADDRSGEADTGDAGGTGDAGDAADAGDGTGVPPLDELLALPGAKAGAWPAGGEVDTSTLELLQRSGLDFVVLDSTNVASATGAQVALGEFEALVADAAMGEATRDSLAGATPVEQAAGDAELASLLALAAQADAPGAVVALDRGALADSSEPLRVFELLDELAWVQTVPESLQFTGTATLRAAAPDEQRRELLRATATRSEQIDGLSPLLEHPEYLLEYQRERLLEAFATRYAEPDVDFAAVDALTKQRDEELLAGVQPVTIENTQLVGTSSQVPITLSNALPFDAAVSLHVTPFSAAISLSERDFEASVPATGSASVLVPVHSRVSSGESALMLEVRDASGADSFSTALQHLVLRTRIEAIMLGALGAAAALLLGFGVWRSVKRKRGEIPTTGAIEVQAGPDEAR